MNDRTPDAILMPSRPAPRRSRAAPDSPPAVREAAAADTDKRTVLTMDDYEQMVRAIEPSMEVVFANATTRTLWSAHAVQRVRRVRGLDQTVYETREPAILGAQIQAYRESHERGLRVRWFYPDTARQPA